MSLYFQTNEQMSDSQKRILGAQYMEINRMRHDVESGRHAPMSTLLANTIGLKTAQGSHKLIDGYQIQLAANEGRNPAEAFREFDRVSEIVKNPIGEFSTLNRVMNFSRSVNIGKQVFEYRKVSGLSNKAQSSMSGQTGVKLDHTSVEYAGTIIPIHDYGFGRNFREIEAMRADGYDALSDDAREADLVIHRKLVDYLWNGNDMELKGNGWRGIKGDPTVIQDTFTLDIVGGTPSTDEIYELFKAKRDILRIANNLGMEMDVAVSREIFSKLETPFSTFTTGYGNLKQMIEGLTGIREIYEDPALEGNEFAMMHIGFEGISAVTGMALSTIALPRELYNSDFSFIKACATGFITRNDYNDNKPALYTRRA